MYAMPDIIETSDAAAGIATTYSMALGQTVQGNVDSGGDHDWYAIDLVAGQTYTFGIVGTGLSTSHLHDPYLRLKNSGGTEVASDDDGGPGYNSTITYTAATNGTYYIDAASYSTTATGEYTISAVEGSARRL